MGTYRFYNEAGANFRQGLASRGGLAPEHTITLRIKDGSTYGEQIIIRPGMSHAYNVDKGVTKIWVKSNIKGWPEAEFKMPAPNPKAFSVNVQLIESPKKMGFDFFYYELK
jgi:hypothetical protein